MELSLTESTEYPEGQLCVSPRSPLQAVTSPEKSGCWDWKGLSARTEHEQSVSRSESSISMAGFFKVHWVPGSIGHTYTETEQPRRRNLPDFSRILSICRGQTRYTNVIWP